MAADRSNPTLPRPHLRLHLPVLGAALLLAGCSGGASPWSPFMGSTNVVESDSLTVQRVRGNHPVVEPLVPEAGDVWPAQEAPRGDLSNPDEAMRNIPTYRPSLIDGAPAASSPVPTPGDRPVRRGSSTPPGNLGPPGAFLTTPAPSQAPPPIGTSPRLEGRALTTPSGQSVTGTGGTPRVQGYTGPSGGGAVIRDGNVETWIGPNGQPSTRVVPN